MDPFWAALLGGAVGGVIVAIIDSFLSRSREHDKWITEQRQERYAELVRAAEGVYRVQNQVMEEAKGRDITGSLRQSIHQRLEAARVEMEMAQLQLQLVASPRLVGKGDEVAGWSAAMWELFDWPKGRSVAYDDLRDRHFNYELIEEFIAAARRGLGPAPTTPSPSGCGTAGSVTGSEGGGIAVDLPRKMRTQTRINPLPLASSPSVS